MCQKSIADVLIQFVAIFLADVKTNNSEPTVHRLCLFQRVGFFTVNVILLWNLRWLRKYLFVPLLTRVHSVQHHVAMTPLIGMEKFAIRGRMVCGVVLLILFIHLKGDGATIGKSKMNAFRCLNHGFMHDQMHLCRCFPYHIWV